MNEHPWLVSLSTPLDEKTISQPVSETNEDWEYIDSEMVKIGTISHNQLDIKAIQQRALHLLETTKDMRVITHLLRTLQHSGDSDELFLAYLLFRRYVELFWLTAYPDMRLKVRLTQQILKRFSGNARSFGQNATEIQKQYVINALLSLSKCWQDKYSTLAEEANSLSQQLSNITTNTAETESTAIDPATTQVKTAAVPFLSPALDITIDNSNERNWKNSLIKMAELLFEQFPERDIAYRLRRTAIWLTVDGILIADNEGITQLSIPVSTDRLSEYLAAVPHATIALLKQVEHSLTLSPYWFEGHLLSANIATKLGFNNVAKAIKEEVRYVLERIPSLKTFKFSDNSFFVNDAVIKWLEQKENITATSLSTQNQNDIIWQCFNDNGLEAALQMLDKLPKQEKRHHFYHQLLEVQLLEKAGLTTLAKQQRNNILSAIKPLSVNEWEPSFFALISNYKE